MKITHNSPKLMGHSEGSPDREVHSNSELPKKDRKFEINRISLHLQELEEQQTKPRQIGRK